MNAGKPSFRVGDDAGEIYRRSIKNPRFQIGGVIETP
jgi:hypothetical protein